MSEKRSRRSIASSLSSPFLATTKSGGERRTMTKLSSLSLATHSFSPVVRLVLRDCVRKMALELHIQPFLFAVWEKSAKRAAQAAADERASEVAPAPVLYFALSSSLSPKLGRHETLCSGETQVPNLASSKIRVGLARPEIPLSFFADRQRL